MQIVLRDFFSTGRIAVNVDAARVGVSDDAGIADKAVGFYSHLGADLVGLFAAGQRLFLYVNDSVDDVPGGATTVSWSQRQESRELTISTNSRRYVFEYVVTVGPVSTPFHSEDEEDADFGLWLRNTLMSAERSQILLDWWPKGIP